MARQTFRANLGSAEFPLLSESYGRSVIVAKQDIHYIRPNAFSGNEADKNIGIPQLIFAENVMPCSYGYQSVDFTVPVPGTANEDYDQAFYLRDAGESKSLFVPAGGQCRVFNPSTAAWVSFPKVVPAGSVCSVAHLKGRTFVFFSGDDDVFEWTGVALPVVAVAGLLLTDILGFTSANSYLIAWNTDTIFWSSTLDPVDFVPSLSSGAGSQKVLGLKGQIVYCKPIPDGFVIYATGGTHYARYSGNIRFPWVFSEVKGSAGIQHHEQACDMPHGNKTYVYTNVGLMAYDTQKAEQEFPVVTEFFAARVIESYDPATKSIVETELNAHPLVKITFIGSRFLVISYGKIELTHALIFDAALGRWGKVKITHVDCFEFFGQAGVAGAFVGVPWVGSPLTDGISWDTYPASAWSDFGPVLSTGAGDTAEPYKGIAFLHKNGQVSVLDFTHTNVNDNAVMYVGRFQFIRDRLTTIQDVEVGGMHEEDTNTVEVLTSYDGQNIDKVTVPKLVQKKKKNRKYQTRVTGLNHILRFRGNFEMHTIVLRTMLNGNR